MIGQQFNGSILGGSFIINHNYYGLSEQEAKQALTEYSDEQLQNALRVLFQERWRVFISPFKMPWVWGLFASLPLFLFCIHYSPLLFSLFSGDLISSLISMLLVVGTIFIVFWLLWQYVTAKMKADIEAINQLLRQNWQMKRWIDEELQARRLQHWKVKCGVKDELKDYME